MVHKAFAKWQNCITAKGIKDKYWTELTNEKEMGFGARVVSLEAESYSPPRPAESRDACTRPKLSRKTLSRKEPQSTMTPSRRVSYGLKHLNVKPLPQTGSCHFRSGILG
jgi:hypothetical protein